jgi:predicted permease
VTRLPGTARWLLRISPVPRERHGEIEADLHELFIARRNDRGAVHAYSRLYHDVASLWVERRPAPPAARRPALAFVRDVRGDLTYAARLFVRQPAILLLTIIGLSLGLAVATAAFTIINAAVLRGEGLVDPDRAPGVVRTAGQASSSVWSYNEFLRLREGATRLQLEAVLTDAALVKTTPGAGDGPAVALAFVSGGFFAATGGRMALGRALEAADEAHAGPPPVVVSHVFWTTRLDRDPRAIGRTITIGRATATIVGVAERRFSVPSNRLVWMPLTTYAAVYDARLPGTAGTRTPAMGVQVFGRLLPDAPLAEAQAQLSGVASAIPVDASAGDGSPLGVKLDPYAGLGRIARSEAVAVTALIFVVIGLVLMLACANVAIVLVSTAITREREMGVRAALGASRPRIVRQLITESLALASIAAAIGVILAWWAVPAIATMIEAPPGADLSPDFRVFLFIAIVTTVTGVGAGLAPALHGRGADLVTPLKGEGARQNRVAPRRLRSLLVATQAAVSVLLIVIATLFVRATFRAAAVDVGFEATGLYAVSPGLGREAFENDGAGVRNFWARAIPELQGIAGLAGVTLAELTPFDGTSKSAMTGEAPSRVVYFNGTRAEFFDTLGLRVLAGRTYTREEVTAGAPVAVVSESLARAYWLDRSPLGQLLPEVIPIPPTSTRPVIIGVVSDAITARLHERSRLTYYEPLAPANEVFANLLIRVAPGTTGVVDAVRGRLRSIEPQAALQIASVAARQQREADQPRMLATLTGVVGIIAILLCVIGLYGLTASVVGQRAREMSVRVAIGAAPLDLLRLLMWDSMRPVAFGLVIGAVGAWAAGRVAVAAMFFGVSPQDPVALAGAIVVLIAAAIVAVLLPTRRAAAVDAAAVLKGS